MTPRSPDHTVNCKTREAEARAHSHESAPSASAADAGLLSPNGVQSFTIRHLKQGGTGARKTWPAAEVLLDYLVNRGGLRSSSEKIIDTNSDTSERNFLDMRKSSSMMQDQTDSIFCHSLGKDFGLTSGNDLTKHYHILELGAGSGYLGVGLATVLNRDSCAEQRKFKLESGKDRAASKVKFKPLVRLLCTDNDRPTIKNMRHNIARQPQDRNITKAVRVEILEWGADIGGAKFAKAVESQFPEMNGTTFSTAGSTDTIPSLHGDSNSVQISSKDNQVTNDSSESAKHAKDPIRLLTHVIASDVLYGRTTLDPLSSVISAIKLRNPRIVVVALLRERSPNAVANLKTSIMNKIRHDLLLLKKCHPEPEAHAEKQRLLDMECLCDFRVTVRDVLHDIDNDSNLKLLEC